MSLQLDATVDQAQRTDTVTEGSQRPNEQGLQPALDERNGLLAVEARRRREATLPELARPVPGADSQVYRP